jgi:hypothetical protein
LTFLGAFAKTNSSRVASPRFELDGGELNGRMISLRIKAIVLASIASLANDAAPTLHGSRQRSIVERCDIRREKCSVVAADLGISLRQFYRERHRAMERLRWVFFLYG